MKTRGLYYDDEVQLVEATKEAAAKRKASDVDVRVVPNWTRGSFA